MSTLAQRFLAQALEWVRTDPQMAWKLLVSAVEADQGLGEAWYWLGNAASDQGKLEAAVAYWKRAVPLVNGEMRGRALCNIGHRLYGLGQLAEAEWWTRRALEVDRDMGYAWANLSAIWMRKGVHEVAVGYGQQAFARCQAPVIEVQLALALLRAGRLADGLRHFEARVPYRIREFEKYPYPRWNGELVERLLVVCEQGLGDTFSFARFVKIAAERVGRVVFGVQPALVGLLQAALPKVEVVAQPAPFPPADVFCPVMSLPTAMGLRDGEIAEAPGVLSVERRPVRGRVAICWAGSAVNETDRWRSLRVEQFLPLAGLPGVRLVSMQVGERAADLHNAAMAGLVTDLAPAIGSAADTARLLAEVDAVVTVDSFLGHLAGELGVPCYVLVSRNAGDWRLGPAVKWYPEHRVFQQQEGESWEVVMGRVVEALG